MREAIGNSLLFNLVVVFVSLIILFFIGILAYSKAYRVKNRIIEIIEKHEDYSLAYEEINASLGDFGYRITSKNECDSEKVKSHLEGLTYNGVSYERVDDDYNNDYNYCVFQLGNSGSNHYYIVTTFVQFDFPFIGDLLVFPVYGETKILGKSYDY